MFSSLECRSLTCLLASPVKQNAHTNMRQSKLRNLKTNTAGRRLVYVLLFLSTYTTNNTGSHLGLSLAGSTFFGLFQGRAQGISCPFEEPEPKKNRNEPRRASLAKPRASLRKQTQVGDPGEQNRGLAQICDLSDDTFGETRNANDWTCAND